MMQYTQDYDEQYPPAYVPRHSEINGMDIPGATYECAIFPYIKATAVFHCPLVTTAEGASTKLSYMYNDLMAEAKEQSLAAPAQSVLVMDGDAPASDVGHAWMPNAPARQAWFNGKGKCVGGRGATVKDAPLRHNGMANYLFADGHAKSLRPDAVFFPPRYSASTSHLDAYKVPIGPDPADAMIFNGHQYSATFHLR
jgi:prepilin-type processing-associated H-X9-DG protein